jgi:hypothetical protein
MWASRCSILASILASRAGDEFDCWAVARTLHAPIARATTRMGLEGIGRILPPGAALEFDGVTVADGKDRHPSLPRRDIPERPPAASKARRRIRGAGGACSVLVVNR